MNDSVSESARRAKAALAAKSPPAKTLSNADFLSTGVTPVNLACSGRVLGGLQRGHIYRLIGKSQTGKTFLGGSILCEAAINPVFANYDLIHNDIELGAKMEPRKFWAPLVSRLKAPNQDNWETPKTLSDWFDLTLARLDKGRPFVEITDSLDALGAPDLEGKMSDGRAKLLSNKIRKLLAGLKVTRSILVLVQHAKVNMGNTWAELVTTGGASPEFYSTLDIWLSKAQQLKRKVPSRNLELAVGVMFGAHVRKNRTNGVDRTVHFPLYYDYGIDDLGACVEFLLHCGHWDKTKANDNADEEIEPVESGKKKKKRPGLIESSEFNFTGYPLDLIKHIEAENKEQELRMLVGRVWREIETALSQGRKPKYGG